MRLLLLLVALVGCTRAPRVKPHPDVIVVVLDTLRADHLSEYGYKLDTSPGIRAFTDAATRFDAAYAPAPWTLPSTSSLMTGLHPLRHQTRHPGDVLPAATETLAERLKAAGWKTAAFSHNINVSQRSGFDQGFDSFTTYKGKVLDYPHIEEMTDAVDDWVDDNGDDPFLLYLQPMNCHGPYRVPDAHKKDLLGRGPNPKFKYYKGPMGAILKKGRLKQRDKVTPTYLRSLQEKYDIAIRYSLDQVGGLFDRLKKEGLYDNALIVLTADHGEELYDHGGFSHGYSLHDEVLHVPLFVKMPGQTKSAVVESPVSLMDVLPTVMEAVSAPVTGVDGRSFLPALRGEKLPSRTLLFDIDWKKRCVAKALVSDGYKLMSIAENYEKVKGAVRLYDMTRDPDEHEDIAASQPDRVTAMQAELDAMMQGYAAQQLAPPENVLGSMNKAQLEALGYLE